MPYCPATGLPCRWCIEPCGITRPRDPIGSLTRAQATAGAIATAIGIVVIVGGLLYRYIN